MMRARCGQRGFTLIETVLVIIVLGIASYGVLSVFFHGLTGSANPVLGVQGVELAKEKMEIVFADKHDSAKGYAHLTGANYPDETPVTGFTDFNRTVQFLEVDKNDLTTPSAGSGFVRITVTVSWSGDSVTLESLATDY